MLTRFSYTDCDGMAGIFKCAVFRVALQQLQGTLRELVLRFRWAVDKTYGGEEIVASFRDWPALRSMRCSVTVLVGRARVRGVVQLREVLPPVVERVVVDVDGNWVDWKEQMVDLVEGEEFARLEEVVVPGKRAWVGRKVGARLQEACDSAGIVLLMY